MARASLLIATALVCGATVLTAGGHSTGNEVVDARIAVMKTMGQSIGVLGNMAKGEMAYDATAAQAAADALLEAAQIDPAELWIEGTGRETVPATRAKPAIFTDSFEVETLSADLVSAAQSMAGAAGTGLDGIRANLGAVGGACSACHKEYRFPKE